MASDPETTSLVHSCGAAVNVSNFPSWEGVSVGTPQTQACHCWGGTAVPTGLGRPIDLQNPKNAELRSPWASATLLQLGSISNTVTLSAKNCLAAGPASPNGSRNLSMILFMELPLKEKFSQSSKKPFLETVL